MFSISNATRHLITTYTVDISTGDTYTHCATAFHKDGHHYGRHRAEDANDDREDF